MFLVVPGGAGDRRGPATARFLPRERGFAPVCRADSPPEQTGAFPSCARAFLNGISPMNHIPLSVSPSSTDPSLSPGKPGAPDAVAPDTPRRAAAERTPL